MMHLLKDLMPQADPTTMRGLLEKPSLAGLSYILRHQELWPVDFHWDYTRCTTCAMGLACRLWPIPVERYGDPHAYCLAMRQAFGLNDYEIAHLFFVQSPKGDCIGNYSPEYIADQIDTHISVERAA